MDLDEERVNMMVHAMSIGAVVVLALLMVLR